LAKSSSASAPRVYQGVPASPGIAVGPVRHLEDSFEQIEERPIPASRVGPEVERFRKALGSAREELQTLRDTTRTDLDEDTARIFDVQLQILQDPMAVERTETAIREELVCAEFLFRRHMTEAWEQLAEVSDAFFRERAVDLKDVQKRVLRHLTGRTSGLQDHRGVLLGRELAPSDAVMLQPDRVLGFVTDSGGATSHAAIMARARGIPAVVGVTGLSAAVKDGEILALDGFRGTVEVNPSAKRVKALRERQRAFVRLEKQHARLADLPAETADGHRIRLSANMELPAELDYILDRGADGIGLFRTEFFFMGSRRAPTEAQQIRVYRGIQKKVGAGNVVIRALDVGGDKMASYMGIIRERNPFFGIRGIRYLLAHPSLLKTQLRAVLQSAAPGKTRLLFPMVSSLEEFETIQKLTRNVLAALKRKGVAHDNRPGLGVMIEVPSAVMMADELARAADFLSVGSNDLIQYLLAIDRNNQALQDLYQPHHPAVLRALKQVVDAAHRHGKTVSICGEMAGDPASTPLLLGLGFDQLSVSPYLIPDIKQTVRALNQADCRQLAEDALACGEAVEVTALIEERLGSAFSDLLQLIDNGVDGAPRKPVRRKRSGS